MKHRIWLIATLLFLEVTMVSCRWLVNFYAFFPDRTDIPSVDRLPEGVAEIFIPTSDGESLQCYWIERPGAVRVLIYFHGNAGNISHRIPDLCVLGDMGIHVLGVGYRGYGKSTGTPSEPGLYIDGRAALAYVTRTRGVTPEQIIVMGRSIGSTVAVDLSQDQPLAALILVTPMTSGKAMGKFHGFGFLAGLAGDAFNNLGKIHRIQCPLLVVHGTQDDIVPFSMGRQLYEQAPSPKQFEAIQGAGHNDISIRGTSFAESYWHVIRKWLQLLPEKS